MPPVVEKGPIPKEGGSFYEGRTNRPFGPDYKIDPATGCWMWQKAMHINGYPQATRFGKPHRIYYQLKHGPISSATHVHHKCKTRMCINPDHLQAVEPMVHFRHHYLNEKAGLTLDDVREIRRLGRLPGQSATEIGKRYGIAKWTVLNYWLGRKWTDMLGEDGPVECPPWPCVECGGDVTGNRHKQYCSPQCKARAAGRRSRRRKVHA